MATNGTDQSDRNASQGSAIRALSQLLGRYHFAQQHGLSFYSSGTYKRQMYDALGYIEKLESEHYWSRFLRGDIAQTIVTAYPEATWRGGATVIEDEDPAISTPFEEAFEELADRLRIWEVMLRADVLAGLGRYAVILIGAPGDLAQEIPRITSPEQIATLSAFPERDAEFDDGRDLVDDPSDPRYGMPSRYKIKLSTKRHEWVHHSRVIHVADGLLDNDIYGRPRLEKGWNRLDDLDKVMGAGAEAFWQRAQPGTHLKFGDEVEVTSDVVEDVEDQVDEWMHKLRPFFTSQGVDVEQLSTSVAGMKDPMDAIVSILAGAYKIPKRMLLGSERGELASSQDRSNFDRRAQDRRDEWAEPHALRPLIDRFIKYNALPPNAGYSILWPSIRDLNDAERAELAGVLAKVNRDAGMVVISRDEIRDKLDLPPFEEVSSGEEEEPATARAAEDFDLTEDPPDEPEWAAVHRAADDNIDAVSAVVRTALDAARDALDTDRLEDALEARNEVEANLAVREAVAAMAETDDDLADVLLTTLIAGGNAAAGVLEPKLSNMRAAQVEIAFDETNPEAVAWARERAAELVKEETAGTSITAETSRALRQQVARGFEEGIPPQVLAHGGMFKGTRIIGINELVGLTTNQSDAVAKLATELLNAEPGSLITRFPPREGIRDVAGFRARVPAGGATEEWVEGRLAQYRRMQLNWRARNIARSETMRASAEGQNVLWRQARERGLLTADTRRTWIATGDERTCVICTDLDGATTTLDEPFEGGFNGSDAHSSCRCAVSLDVESLSRAASFMNRVLAWIGGRRVA